MINLLTYSKGSCAVPFRCFRRACFAKATETDGLHLCSWSKVRDQSLVAGYIRLLLQVHTGGDRAQAPSHDVRWTNLNGTG